MGVFIARLSLNGLLGQKSPLKGLKPLYQINACQQVRHLNLHEHENMKLLQDGGVKVPPFGVAYSPAEARKIAEELGSTDLVVKAQVHAGGRGKGRFDNGFDGGVHLVPSEDEAEKVASLMIGAGLKTKQTGDHYQPCHKVLIAQQSKVKKEFYFSIMNSAEHNFQGPVIVGSSEGGMDIEEVSKTSPQLIHKFPLHVENEFTHEYALQIADKLGFSSEAKNNAASVMRKLYDIFIKKDVLMLEINPLCEGYDGDVSCLDAKFNFDDNASYRQEDLFQLRDWTQRDAREKTAHEDKLSFIPLDGNIGCLVNGAGLAMATMDIIKLHGGEAANFLDIGGGATSQAVNAAFKLITSDPNVKVILVNIFGGIIQCDLIAQGIIDAKTNLSFQSPIVCRLQGSRMKEAKELLESSKLEIIACQSFDEAAKKAVELSQKL